jgi:N-acyl homoserine lactone hydrolase
MKRVPTIAAAAALFLAGAFLGSAPADAQSGGVDRLYVIDCGQGHAQDRSRWSPGVDVGQPVDLVDHCYLIHHARDGYMLWDTGVADRVAAMPDGLVSAGGAMVWRKPKTLAGQLEAIGVKPSDIRYVGVSHTHADHVGNVDLFPGATVLMQKAEYDWAFAQPKPPFAAEHPVTKLEGDKDVFGDGSVMILSTPGHTPGHQSLLVRLPKTGAVLLSGDAVHFQSNWDNRRVPGFNFSKDATLASMQRLAEAMTADKAQLWINHDKPQGDRQRMAPEYYE